MKVKSAIIALLLSFILFLSACDITFTNDLNQINGLFEDVAYAATLDEIPAFDGKQPYVVLNDNQPAFADSDMTAESYEYYSQLDELGRCGVVMACVGIDIMPTEERGEIGMIKPTGWHTVKYDNVDGKYLYNRCHLIGYQLTGENANIQNLITGTRYLNIDGMLPFENVIAEYVRETGNHVLYRVTPIFIGNNLLASGVQMEAMSVEDGGDTICFNVYAYNAHPDIIIDYASGKSYLSDSIANKDSSEVNTTYIINKNSKKFHKSDCASIKDTKSHNKKETDKSYDELINMGYSPCKSCFNDIS